MSLLINQNFFFRNWCPKCVRNVSENYPKTVRIKLNSNKSNNSQLINSTMNSEQADDEQRVIAYEARQEKLRIYTQQVNEYFTTNLFHIGTHYNGYEMADAMVYNDDLVKVCHILKIVGKEIVGVEQLPEDRLYNPDVWIEYYQTEEIHLKACEILNEMLGKYFPMRIIPGEGEDEYTIDKGPEKLIYVGNYEDLFAASVTVFYVRNRNMIGSSRIVTSYN